MTPSGNSEDLQQGRRQHQNHLTAPTHPYAAVNDQQLAGSPRPPGQIDRPPIGVSARSDGRQQTGAGNGTGTAPK